MAAPLALGTDRVAGGPLLRIIHQRHTDSQRRRGDMLCVFAPDSPSLSQC